MATIIYGRPSDNIASRWVWTLSAGDAAYPAANLYDLNPAKPAKLTTTSGRFSGDAGSAVQVDLVALIHHNFAAGLNVRLQSSALSDFSVLQIDQPFTIPAYRENNFPIYPFLDLSGIGSRTWRYWRVNVVGSNPVVCALGEIVVLGAPGAARTLTRNITWGVEVDEDNPVIEHRTDYGVSTLYSLGTTWRTVRGNLDTSDAGAAEFATLARSAQGRALPWLLIPDPTINDALFGRFTDPKWTRRLEFLDRNSISFTFEELSCGLKPTPSAV